MSSRRIGAGRAIMAHVFFSLAHSHTLTHLQMRLSQIWGERMQPWACGEGWSTRQSGRDCRVPVVISPALDPEKLGSASRPCSEQRSSVEHLTVCGTEVCTILSSTVHTSTEVQATSPTCQ